VLFTDRLPKETSIRWGISLDGKGHFKGDMLAN